MLAKALRRPEAEILADQSEVVACATVGRALTAFHKEEGAVRRHEQPQSLGSVRAKPRDGARRKRHEAGRSVLAASHRDDALLEVDIIVIERERLVDPEARHRDQPEQGRARPTPHAVAGRQFRRTNDDRRQLRFGVDVGPATAQPAGDQSRRRHLRACILTLQPAGEAAHHAEPGRPGVVAGLAEALLPAKEQIDRDVVGTLAICERGEAPQDSSREG
jgi:hypothetical protein